MNVLYLHRQSEWGEELRYSLRSVEKYVKPDKVYVVGDIPHWLTNAEGILVKWRMSRYKDSNQLIDIALRVVTSERMILMHDDFFLLEDYEPVLRYTGTIEDRAKRTGGERREVFDNTLENIPNGTNYALHYPLPFNTNAMRTVFSTFRQPFSYMSAYGNADKDFKHIESKDCKLNPNQATPQKLKGMPCFSTYNEQHSQTLKDTLNKLYPNPSKYESRD